MSGGMSGETSPSKYFERYYTKQNSTENWLEAKVNVVQILSSLRSISTGLCLKNF